jgi:thioesterase domain-containing protein
MSALMPISRHASFGIDYLQDRLDREFPLVPHIGVEVQSADDRGVVLRAPFAPNINDNGTAFGGSLFSLAVLAGWAWATRYLAVREIAADAVIQESTIRYLAPVTGELRAVLDAPQAPAVDKFRRMLERAGRGRIRLQVGVFDGKTLATQFDGSYAALAPASPRRTSCPEN